MGGSDHWQIADNRSPKHQRMDTRLSNERDEGGCVLIDAPITHHYSLFSGLRTLFHKCEHEEPLVLIIKTLKGSVSDDTSLNMSFVSFLRFSVPS